MIKVPRGKVTTYGALGKSIGCRSARAIGQALKHNIFAPDVPCHRVIAVNRNLHGFAGSRGEESLNRKKRLLVQEGIEFDENNRVLKDYII